MVSIPPGSTLGRYRVLEQLGRGGMATVFKAHDPTLNRNVAIKVLPSYHTEDPTFVARFAQEAQTVAQLNHPNILQIYDFGDDKGFSYLVSELVEGGTLQDKLKSQPIDINEVLAWMEPLAEALDYAHAQGIVHRDIKPANVLLNEDDQPILADFGLARMLESAQRFTMTSQALGTPEYMSPEQGMGNDADYRSDLYAFGVMLYQMLVGRTPFRADTPAATLMAHVHQPLPLPTLLNPDINPKVEATLLKSLAKNPEDRFANARLLIQSLRMAVGLVDEGVTEDLDVTSRLSPANDATLAIDAPTAVIGASATSGATAPIPGTAGPPAAPPDVAEGAAPGPRRWIGAIIGTGAAVIVALVAILILFNRGDDPPITAAQPTIAPSVVVSEPTAIEPEPRVSAPEPSQIPIAVATAMFEQLKSEIPPNVMGLRDIAIEIEVDIKLRTSERLAEITRGRFREEDLRQQVFEAEQLYKALGLMDEELRLEDVLFDIQIQQISALYDDVQQQVYVISDATKIGPKLELSLAAAFMGGAQEQLFGVTKLRDTARAANSDEFRALNALIQGDVARVSDGYIATFLTEEEGVELSEPIPGNKLLAAPPVVQKTVAFPQSEGRNFVIQLGNFEGLGWLGVNAGYEKPPLSTEQVLHPEKYFDDEEPKIVSLPDIVDQLGSGWQLAVSDTMGEFLLRVYLEDQIDPDTAAEAAAGWGGDKYALLNGPEGQRLFIMNINWDSFIDRGEFARAFQLFAQLKLQNSEDGTVEGDDSGQLWVLPDETMFLGSVDQITLLIIGKSRRIVLDALEALGRATPTLAP